MDFIKVKAKVSKDFLKDMKVKKLINLHSINELYIILEKKKILYKLKKQKGDK